MIQWELLSSSAILLLLVAIAIWDQKRSLRKERKRIYEQTYRKYQQTTSAYRQLVEDPCESLDG